jgi:hypothetical protein
VKGPDFPDIFQVHINGKLELQGFYEGLLREFGDLNNPNAFPHHLEEQFKIPFYFILH